MVREAIRAMQPKSARNRATLQGVLPTSGALGDADEARAAERSVAPDPERNGKGIGLTDEQRVLFAHAKGLMEPTAGDDAVLAAERAAWPRPSGATDRRTRHHPTP